MTLAELNAKYPLEGSGTRWHVSEEGLPALWVDTARGGYEIAWVDMSGKYVGPSGFVLVADIAKLAQASAEEKRKMEIEEAERIIAGHRSSQ